MWFGVIVVLLAEIGLVSPPLVALLILVVLLTFVPDLVLRLPGTVTD